MRRSSNIAKKQNLEFKEQDRLFELAQAFIAVTDKEIRDDGAFVFRTETLQDLVNFLDTCKRHNLSPAAAHNQLFL